MEGIFSYRTEKAEINRDKMHLTVLNHYPGYQGEWEEAEKREAQNQLFQVFKKYNG